MVGVAGSAIARNLRDDLRAARHSMLKRFEQKHACALAHHKSAALRVKRDARALRVGRLRERLHRGEAADCQQRDARLRAAAEHRVGVAVPYIMEGIPNGIAASGARCHRAGAHAPEAYGNGDLPRRHVADCGGDVKRRYPVKSALHAAQMLRFGDDLPANAT